MAAERRRRRLLGTHAPSQQEFRHAAILRAARAVSRLSIALVADYRLYRGIEIPQPAIFIAPHRSMFDIPLGVETFRRLGISPLLVVSRSNLLKLRLPVSNWGALDLLPIARDSSGRSSLLEAGGEALTRGRSVAIMPEGRVIRAAHDGEAVRSGAADLALRASAPVVVLGSAGSGQFWQRGRPTTFVKFSRKPVAVVTHDVIWPEGDSETTRVRIATSLAIAEAHAESCLNAGRAR